MIRGRYRAFGPTTFSACQRKPPVLLLPSSCALLQRVVPPKQTVLHRFYLPLIADFCGRILVRSMTAISEHAGGIRWGDSFWLASYASWPFAHLLICDDHLLLTYPEGAYDFPRASVVRLSCRSGRLSRALKLGWGSLRIEHAVSDYPPYVRFWTFDISSLCDNLSAAGYSVQA